MRLSHIVLAVVLVLGACGGGESAGEDGGLTGAVRIDGSSTVFPIMEAVVEEFQIENRGVRVTVGISGTGGGLSHRSWSPWRCTRARALPGLVSRCSTRLACAYSTGSRFTLSNAGSRITVLSRGNLPGRKRTI